ncbi:uncharacterized protein [Physcomitrium patens]|uniref:Zinc finger PHD-type domain-containing protein n=1 Tax=Physcomitrium patens TaxID=3218 RepID=A0A2K1IDZ0_PHYPA|nr:uncharacterized protein LOC112277482 [Physcomitrium patens]PNR27492.1 hypothetical protein PHYPA_029644 [Physcomitrium patens]|eukprot:XP_024365636.1 uncharacterized protein LOC112277482 [Physcomitrella patens]
MGGKAHPPSSSESDYWGDESWTVDCPCGVSFDDGEEMVECDECAVWVHTACCRVPKGLTTYVCDKCKSKKKKESEEAPEIPEAAPSVDLPFSGADTLHTTDLVRKPNEVPILDRVHVQGIPGGDPSLFVNVSKVFSQQLWKYTGYVPKAFHTKCKDIPSLPCIDDTLERFLSLLSSRKEASPETMEDVKPTERVKEEDLGNVRKGTMGTVQAEKPSKLRDPKKAEVGKSSKSVQKSSRSNRDGKVQLHLKRSSEEQNRKESHNKRPRTGNSVRTEEESLKEDEFSRSEGEPAARGKSPIFSRKNPKAMKKMAVQEFMDGHVSILGTRCTHSEQIQSTVA